MRVTFRSQHKIRSTFIARGAAVGATVGVTPALIVLPLESEVNKMEYAIAFAVVAMMALYVLIIGRCLREA
jgi:aromatic ring hydroxylase